MQNAKDTFYEVLRDRVAAADAALTVVVRGVVRPGVVVDENELAGSAEMRDCFRMRWTSLQVGGEGAAPLATMRCEVRYGTAGSLGGGGLDRGRALAGMDAVLLSAVEATPQTAVKKNFAALAGGGAVSLMGSQIWWGDVAFGAVSEDAGEIRRTATVDVWSYQEAGEV